MRMLKRVRTQPFAAVNDPFLRKVMRFFHPVIFIILVGGGTETPLTRGGHFASPAERKRNEKPSEKFLCYKFLHLITSEEQKVLSTSLFGASACHK